MKNYINKGGFGRNVLLTRIILKKKKCKTPRSIVRKKVSVYGVSSSSFSEASLLP